MRIKEELFKWVVLSNKSFFPRPSLSSDERLPLSTSSVECLRAKAGQKSNSESLTKMSPV